MNNQEAFPIDYLASNTWRLNKHIIGLKHPRVLCSQKADVDMRVNFKIPDCGAEDRPAAKHTTAPAEDPG